MLLQSFFEDSPVLAWSLDRPAASARRPRPDPVEVHQPVDPGLHVGHQDRPVPAGRHVAAEGQPDGDRARRDLGHAGGPAAQRPRPRGALPRRRPGAQRRPGTDRCRPRATSASSSGSAAAIDLAGRDVLDAVQTCVNPKVIDCPQNAKVAAMAKDGIQVLAKARVTVRTNIHRLVGGATEETIIARVGEGIVSTIGSSDTHKQVLENPDRISKGVLEKGLDAGTAFEILSIDIADVDIGDNIGARLQADQAEADKRVAQAAAEVVVARWLSPTEQESVADIAANRAKLVLAEAEVPLAMAEAFKNGQPRHPGLPAHQEHRVRHAHASAASRLAKKRISKPKKTRRRCRGQEEPQSHGQASSRAMQTPDEEHEPWIKICLLILKNSIVLFVVGAWLVGMIGNMLKAKRHASEQGDASAAAGRDPSAAGRAARFKREGGARPSLTGARSRTRSSCRRRCRSRLLGFARDRNPQRSHRLRSRRPIRSRARCAEFSAASREPEAVLVRASHVGTGQVRAGLAEMPPHQLGAAQGAKAHPPRTARSRSASILTSANASAIATCRARSASRERASPVSTVSVAEWPSSAAVVTAGNRNSHR